MKKTHKLLAVVLSVIMILSAMSVIPFTASAETEGIFRYSVSDGEATITGLVNENISAIEIPNTIGGYPVTSIGDNAFYGCSKLTSITIPDSVKSIGYYTFTGCTGLKTAGPIGCGYDYEFGWTDKIPDHAFSSCKALTSITIPDSVTEIGDNAFSFCLGLTGIIIPDNVISIGDWAFYCCSGLMGITIPDNVTSIGDNAFYGCSKLTSITIPDSVTSIGIYAFSNCSKLTSITISDSITYMGSDAFENCPINDLIIAEGSQKITKTMIRSFRNTVQNITIPDSITSIESYAFEGCDNLEYNIYKYGKYLGNDLNPYLILIKTELSNSIKEFEFAENVKIVSPNAFEGCTGLTSITIPNSVISIGNNAFYGCTSLENAIISNNTINIENNAIGNYRNYVSVYFTFNREEDNTSIGDSYNYIIKRYNYNIKELLINDITLVEGTNVSLKTDDEGNEYFSYDIYPEYTVVLADGREVTSSSTYTDIDDTEYVFKIRDDLNTKNFLPGNTYTLTGSLGGKSCTFNLTIEPTPVKKIEIVKNSNDYFVENYGGYISKDKNGNDYYHYGEYYSPFYNKFEDAEFKITYKDGTYKTATLFEYIDGCQVTPTDNQYEHPWTVGTNNVEVYFMGVTGIMPVTVIKNPVRSLELVSGTSIKYLENVGGYLNTWNGNYFSYYTEEPNDAKIKINYTDGTSTIVNVGDNVNGFYVAWESNQPWSVGENASTITYLNHEVNLPITVASEDAIKSIEAKLNFEFVEGYTIDSRYQIPYNLLNVTVNYKDGTSETKPIRKWKYITLDDNQEENPWVVGTNYVTVHYGNYTCDLEIIVKPSTSFAEKYHSTVLMDDEIKLNWLTEDEFSELGLNFENDEQIEDPNGPYAIVSSMDDEQLSNIAKQFFDIANLEVKDRFRIDNAAFVSFIDGDNWSNKIFMMKTTDGEHFEKVSLPEDMGDFDAYWESRVWQLKKYKDTYILAGLSCIIGKELFYFTSKDLITWEKHTFSIDSRTYCSNLSFAGITDNGVYFIATQFDVDPVTYSPWLRDDIYYTSDFENIRCITESFEDYTYYQTQSYNDQLANSNSNNSIAFIAFHYCDSYDYDYEWYVREKVDNAKLCSYNEVTGKVTVIESIDSQPTYWWFKLAGSDPRWYSSNYGNICYTFSVDNQNIIQTAVLPFDVDDIRAGWESNFDSNENSYHLSINVTSNEMYISGDYWRTAYIIELPEEVANLDIYNSDKRIELLENETEIYIAINGVNGSYYFDFTPVKNALAGIHCDHIKTELKNAKKATCTENGYTGDTYCKDCGQLMEKGKVIPALGHSGIWKTITKATLTEKGLKREICAKCGEVLGEEVIPVLTETYSLETAKENAQENISVAPSAESNLPETVEVKAEKTKADDKQVTYEIRLEDNGEVIQPEATVLVKLPIPAGFNKNKLNIYRTEPDGSKTRLDFIIDGDYAYFETDHFSIYEIIEKLCGDINGDDKVNNKDLTRLFQKLSGWSVETSEVALDINGDGKVNNKDLTRLFQYLSGWDVEIY